MNYQRTRKYFEQKNTTYPIVIAAALIAVGFIMIKYKENNLYPER